MEERKRREVEFHDDAYSDETRAHLWSTCYPAGDPPDVFFHDQVAARCADADVLEYGCGVSSVALFLAERGARRVQAIDISPVAVEKDAERAREAGLEQLTFRVMDAEDLDFPDQSFDLVCGRSILHHLDVDRSYREVRRVLRQAGTAIFLEPLGHNPLINLYRRRTPELRSPDERPLMMSDLEAAHRHFGTVRARFFHLLDLAGAPLRGRGGDAASSALGRLDRMLFRALPFTQRYAWQMVIELRDPLGSAE